MTSDSGYFWFFEPSNAEVLVKALNGCGANGNYWVFSAGLTDVEVTMTVTDTQTGTVKTYTNPQGTAFQPILDSAFASCAAAAMTAANPEEPSAGWQRTGPATEAARSDSQAGCVSSDTALCVNGGRFLVEATWQTAAGAAGAAHAVRLTSDSGYFWFFDASNIEVMFKSLDACSVNGRQWFFAAGVTDVAVEIHVTDTQTGEIKTYSNAQGTPFAPILDTGAFSVCPATAAAGVDPEARRRSRAARRPGARARLSLHGRRRVRQEPEPPPVTDRLEGPAARRALGDPADIFLRARPLRPSSSGGTT